MKQKMMAMLLALCLLAGCLAPGASAELGTASITLHYQDGATPDGTADLESVQDKLMEAVLPAPQRSGYALVGWNTQANGDGAWYLPSMRKSLWKDEQGYYDYRGGEKIHFSALYAQWESITESRYLVYWSGRIDTSLAEYRVVEISDSEYNAGSAVYKTGQELGFSKKSADDEDMTVYEWNELTAYKEGGNLRSSFVPGAVVSYERPMYLHPSWGTRQIMVHYTDKFTDTLIVNDERQTLNLPVPQTLPGGAKIFLGYNSQADGNGAWYGIHPQAYVVQDNELWAQWSNTRPVGDYVTFHTAGSAGQSCPTQIVEKSGGGYLAPEFTTSATGATSLGWGFSEYNYAGYDDGMFLNQLIIRDGDTRLNPDVSVLAYAPNTKITWLESGASLYSVCAYEKNDVGYTVPKVVYHPNGGTFAYGAQEYWISDTLSSSEECSSLYAYLDTDSKIGVEFGGVERPFVKLFATIPSGKELIGWNTQADGNGTAYSLAKLRESAIPVSGQRMDLYAQWKEKSTEPINPGTTGDTALLAQAGTYGLLEYGQPANLGNAFTRLDMTKLLVSLAGIEVDTETPVNLNFTDCQELTNAEKAVIKAAVDEGIIQEGGGTFGPASLVTRTQLAKMLDQLLNGNSQEDLTASTRFTDLDSHEWYYDAVVRLEGQGIFATETTTFSPNATAVVRDALRWFVAVHEYQTLQSVPAITMDSAVSVNAGGTVTVTTSITPAISSPALTWSSSNESVATVENGTIKGVNVGTATITVQLANGNSASISVSVTGGGIAPTPSDPTIPDEPEEPENPEEPVVETDTAADGTVTTTTTWPDGKTAVAVQTPAGDKEITVTSPEGEELAKVTIPSNPGPGKKFEDVKDESWYKESVNNVTALGLFQGTSEAKFTPNAPLTRGMLVTALHRLSGEAEYGLGTNAFPDVKENAWYADAADWANKVGVASGDGKGFNPDGNITREQLVTMLYRYADLIGAKSKNSASLTKFPDGGNVSDYAQAAMAWAVAEGFIQGRNGEIVPRGNATRAEVAAVLTRFVDYLG